MNAQEVIAVIARSVQDQKERGVDALPVRALEAVLVKISEMVKASGSEPVSSGELERYKVQLASHLEQQKRDHEWNIELMRGTLAYGQFALKSSLLVNGGATVALLAFLGNVWTVAEPSRIVMAITNVLLVFGFGVFSAVVAAGAGYFAQAGYSKEFGRHSIKIGTIAHWAAGIFALASFGLFGLGIWTAAHAIAGAVQ